VCVFGSRWARFFSVMWQTNGPAGGAGVGGVGVGEGGEGPGGAGPMFSTWTYVGSLASPHSSVP
jgi:hypothetical protein